MSTTLRVELGEKTLELLNHIGGNLEINDTIEILNRAIGIAFVVTDFVHDGIITIHDPSSPTPGGAQDSLVDVVVASH